MRYRGCPHAPMFGNRLLIAGLREGSVPPARQRRVGAIGGLGRV